MYFLPFHKDTGVGLLSALASQNRSKKVKSFLGEVEVPILTSRKWKVAVMQHLLHRGLWGLTPTVPPEIAAMWMCSKKIFPKSTLRVRLRAWPMVPEGWHTQRRVH